MDDVSESRESYWREQVRCYEESGLTYRGYARRAGISHSRLTYWSNKFRDAALGKAVTREKSDFVSLEPRGIECEGLKKMELELPGGITLRVWG